MTKAPGRFIAALSGVNAILLLLALSAPATVVADTAKTARASAFGLELSAPVGLEAQPLVEAAVPPGPDATADDSLLQVPADPAATSFTAHVEAQAAVQSAFEAVLGPTIAGQVGGTLPRRFNARSFAIAEDLEAVADNVKADVIESEALAACVGGRTVFATGARVLNLSVGPQSVPLINPTPNQVVFNQGGIQIVFWETNWDPATLRTTDGSPVVFANALHITAPGGIDLVVSHSEAQASCGAGGGRGPGPGPGTQGNECEDGIDNDGDGVIDFPGDPGCTSPSDDNETSDCDDNNDNDGDGIPDFPADPGCDSRADDDETSECDDGIDNDGDGIIDFPSDPGCDSRADDDETDFSEAPQPQEEQPVFTG